MWQPTFGWLCTGPRRYQDPSGMADLVQRGLIGLNARRRQVRLGARVPIFRPMPRGWRSSGAAAGRQQHGPRSGFPSQVGSHIQRLELTRRSWPPRSAHADRGELDEATGDDGGRALRARNVRRVTASSTTRRSESATRSVSWWRRTMSDFVADGRADHDYDRVRDAVEKLPDLQRDVLRLRLASAATPCLAAATASASAGRPPGPSAKRRR